MKKFFYQLKELFHDRVFHAVVGAVILTNGVALMFAGALATENDTVCGIILMLVGAMLTGISVIFRKGGN